MGTKEKLTARFKMLPSDFSFAELNRLLKNYGYAKIDKGKTSGSRMLYRRADGSIIMMHKPHPGNTVKMYVLKMIYEEHERKGLI